MYLWVAKHISDALESKQLPLSSGVGDVSTVQANAVKRHSIWVWELPYVKVIFHAKNEAKLDYISTEYVGSAM